MEEDILALQADETGKWVAEFNSGLALLGDLIKSQRETAEKHLQELRTAVEARDTARQPGAIEVTIVHKAGVVPVRIRLDDGAAVEFAGTLWSQNKVPSGLHTVEVTSTSQPPVSVQRVANVPPAGIVALEVRMTP
jgi:hypothetical protein